MSPGRLARTLCFLIAMVCAIPSAAARDVYVAGCYFDGSTIFPCYWKNSERFDFPIDPGTNGIVYSITVSNGIVYACGAYSDPEGRKTPCYWKGQKRIDLFTESDYSACAYDIKVVAAEVYIVGIHGQTAWMWTKNRLTILPGNESNSAAAISIAVEKGKIYVGGYYKGEENEVPCYWEGEKRMDLPLPTTEAAGDPDRGYVNSIAVEEGRVYACGRCNGRRETACLWTDKGVTVLPTPLTGFAGSYDIAVVKGVPYVSGYYLVPGKETYIPCYWRGTKRVDLPRPGKNDGDANAIAVVKAEVFTAGTYCIEGTTRAACYWTGTKRHDLPAGKAVSIRAYALWVSP